MKNAESYNKKLNELFEEWKNKSKENKHTQFCRDGLMYKGDVYDEINDLKSPGNEDELWHSAPKRVLFLCKDGNNSGCSVTQDYKAWHYHKKGKNITKDFPRNIAYWLYGLLNVDETGLAPEFETLTVEKITDFFDKTPFALVNCKKEAGGGTVDGKVLQRHIDLYKEYINKEIEILNPDIIVCGGTRKSFFYGSGNIYEPFQYISDNGWIYYNEPLKKLIIASWHPSYPKRSYGKVTEESVYTEMMAAYKEFIDKYPDFLKNNTR